jgi:hypothetical protein
MAGAVAVSGVLGVAVATIFSSDLEKISFSVY